MAHHTEDELRSFGFASLGRGVLISRDARIYGPQRMRIGDHVRIDDFCILSGTLELGRNIYLAPGVQLAGGAGKVIMEDFSTCAFNVVVTASSDDYLGASLTGPTVPDALKPGKVVRDIRVGRHAIIGAGSVLLPGARLGEGSAIGALSLVKGDVAPWTIQGGNPLKRIGERRRDLLRLEADYLSRENAPR